MARVRRITINQAGLRQLGTNPSTTTYRQMRRIGVAVHSTAVQLAPVDTGRLRQSGDVTMRPGFPRMAVRIGFYARHAFWAHQGRRGFEAKPGKVLAWRKRGGPMVFRKRVGPAKGRPFLTRAVQLVTGKSTGVPTKY
ncbi:hypothetical protein [Amycolatopsis thermophila]|uniref:Uncharacterized protein n=1 Tax=Amycolatopsis thermophila TaxID=206084 RepID=A0ABU0ENC0_9PSEU|nr:hypothetical protein [Amycolatopsis thermophila]MDQ0376495.1 hypothetical protein [Amycolatopsis thermophila]